MRVLQPFLLREPCGTEADTPRSSFRFFDLCGVGVFQRPLVHPQNEFGGGEEHGVAFRLGFLEPFADVSELLKAIANHDGSLESSVEAFLEVSDLVLQRVCAVDLAGDPKLSPLQDDIDPLVGARNIPLLFDGVGQRFEFGNKECLGFLMEGDIGVCLGGRRGIGGRGRCFERFGFFIWSLVKNGPIDRFPDSRVKSLRQK